MSQSPQKEVKNHISKLIFWKIFKKNSCHQNIVTPIFCWFLLTSIPPYPSTSLWWLPALPWFEFFPRLPQGLCLFFGQWPAACHGKGWASTRLVVGYKGRLYIWMIQKIGVNTPPNHTNFNRGVSWNKPSILGGFCTPIFGLTPIFWGPGWHCGGVEAVRPGMGLGIYLPLSLDIQTPKLRFGMAEP